MIDFFLSFLFIFFFVSFFVIIFFVFLFFFFPRKRVAIDKFLFFFRHFTEPYGNSTRQCRRSNGSHWPAADPIKMGSTNKQKKIGKNHVGEKECVVSMRFDEVLFRYWVFTVSPSGLLTPSS